MAPNELQEMELVEGAVVTLMDTKDIWYKFVAYALMSPVFFYGHMYFVVPYPQQQYTLYGGAHEIAIVLF